MIELLASVGWGLLAFGSITHVWHHQQLRKVLAMHIDRERGPAMVLALIEVGLTIAIAAAFLSSSGALRWLAVAALVLASGFIVWTGRLLVTRSELPCACSFSEAPTSVWSFGRSCCVALVGLFAFAGRDISLAPIDGDERVAVLAVGFAVASAIFVLPEALTWPDASRALLARVDAHTSPADTP